MPQKLNKEFQEDLMILAIKRLLILLWIVIQLSQFLIQCLHYPHIATLPVLLQLYAANLDNKKYHNNDDFYIVYKKVNFLNLQSKIKDK